MDSHCVWIITGPNMGGGQSYMCCIFNSVTGKSTFLRQNALIVILSQVSYSDITHIYLWHRWGVLYLQIQLQ